MGIISPQPCLVICYPPRFVSERKQELGKKSWSGRIARCTKGGISAQLPFCWLAKFIGFSPSCALKMLYTCRWLCFSALLHQTHASDHQFERDYIKDTLVDNLSFGQKGSNTWTDDHRHIKGWDISGEGYTPELWSDRVMLTPPWPGQRRGAIWAQKPESNAEWEAEFEFRAFGLDNGNGNMQFWYVRNATEDVGTSSIYTVGKFDGVAVVVSQTEGGKGKVRAFLNDGSLSFKDHHKVEELSFGECDLEYRNLGAFSRMRVEQTYWTFKVDIDGKSCINTYSVRDTPNLLAHEC